MNAPARPAPLFPTSPNAEELEKRKRYLREQLAKGRGLSPYHRRMVSAELHDLEHPKTGEQG